MRVFMLTASFIPSSFANSIQVIRMAEAAAERGHDVQLFCRAAGEPVDWQTVQSMYGIHRSFKLVQFRNSRRSWLGNQLLALRYLAYGYRVGKPDLWFCRHVYSAIMLTVLGAPVVLELHAMHRSRIVRMLISWAISRRNMKRVVVISNALREDVVKDCTSDVAQKVIVLHDGARDDADRLGTSDDDSNIVGFAGSFHRGKGIETVIELARRLPDVHFEVIGGPEETLRDKQLPANLIYCGRKKPGEVASILRRWSVALLPNQSEVTLEGNRGDIGKWTSPLKLFEYMSARKAIVASDLPVLREVLRNGENAILVNPLDPNEWVGAIQQLQTDSALRKRLADCAYDNFRREYTWNRRVALAMEEQSPVP